MEAFIGQITLFAGNYPPAGWQFCQGQILSIAQFTAVYSLLGTTYGGDGQTTFALPDLRGRAPIQQGQGPGLTNRVLGEQAGTETVTLITNQMPAHNHLLSASSAGADAGTPAGNFNAVYQNPETGDPYNIYGTTSNASMNAAAINVAGGNQPHSNMQPYLAINYIICLQGIYPSRN